MVALNEAYVKFEILYSNINNRAILFQETARRVKGVLGEFDYASYSENSAVESPELMLFQSIRSLKGIVTSSTRLDDWESILYLMCWLGTFGINPTQRREYTVEYATRKKPRVSIMDWIQRSAIQIAQHKRLHLLAVRNLRTNIVSRMRENSPLRQRALDLYRLLFLHPGCYGVTLVTNEELAEM
ncbi:hypothetical protein IW146_000199 [Coemansia sp. RSA 922]|nr:hypothetical protein IW146_000199 [Coemansia sp. RSA 922]